MTVSLVGTGTPVGASAGAPQTAVAPTPANLANGNRVYVFAVSEPVGSAGSPTLSANGTGWEQLHNNDPGSTRLSVWWRDKDASWSTMPTVSNALGTSTTNALIVGSAAVSSDGTLAIPQASDFTYGADTTSGTGFSATGANDLALAAGQYLFALVGAGASVTASAESLSATGATLGTVSELADASGGGTGAVGFKLYGAQVTAGPSSAAPTVACTLSGSTTGSAMFLAVREVSAADNHPDVVRTGNSFTPAAVGALATTLSSAAVAGELIVYCRGHDKVGGTLTMTDNIGTNGGANPWTVEVSLSSTSVSLYIAWKVAVGGETTITGTTGTNGVSGDVGCALVLSQTGSAAWGLCAKATNPTAETTTTSVATGTTGAATFDGLAIAAATVDSEGNINGTGNGTVSWSNSYQQFYNQGAVGDGGGAGLWVAIKDVDQGATTTSTMTAGTGSAADQMSGAVVVLGRQGVDTPAAETTPFFLAAA